MGAEGFGGRGFVGEGEFVACPGMLRAQKKWSRDSELS